MFAKERPLPKAVNIVRPSSFRDTWSTSPSEISSFSHNRPPSIFNPTPLFQSINTFKSSTVGVNPHAFLQRPRSGSSASSFFSAFSDNSASGDDEYDDLNSIDGMTDDEAVDDDIDNEEEYDDDIDNEEEYDDELDDEDEFDEIKVVARVKNGTIMNGKGEFVNKNKNDNWLEDARTNRKIADLEIENQTLIFLNASLENKVKEQREYIESLEKKLNESPFDYDDDDDDDESMYSIKSIEENEEESEKIFRRVKSTLDSLIEQAENSLIDEEIEREETLRKLTMPSGVQIGRHMSGSRPASVNMSRSISRRSSPPIMQRSPSLNRPVSLNLAYPPLQRSSSLEQRSLLDRHSSLDSSHAAKSNWH